MIKSFNDVEFESLREILVFTRGLANVVKENYHDKGTLHLGICRSVIGIDTDSMSIILQDCMWRYTTEQDVGDTNNETLDTASNTGDDDADVSATDDSDEEDMVKTYKDFVFHWAPIEQTAHVLWYRICPATDLYLIGKIMFHTVMGRHPIDVEHYGHTIYRGMPHSKYINDTNFTDVKKKLLCKMLTKFFKKAMAAMASERFQTADEMISAIDGLLAIV